jgi:hypothetical protein
MTFGAGPLNEKTSWNLGRGRAEIIVWVDRGLSGHHAFPGEVLATSYFGNLKEYKLTI